MFINMERTGPLKAWGYTVDDARWLQAEIEKQALEKYIAGEYTLIWLDGLSKWEP